MTETLKLHQQPFNQQVLDNLVDASSQGDLEWKEFCSIVDIPPDKLNPLPAGILSFESTFIKYFGKHISRTENKKVIIRTWKHEAHRFELVWNKRQQAFNGKIRVYKQEPRHKKPNKPDTSEPENDHQPRLFD